MEIEWVWCYTEHIISKNPKTGIENNSAEVKNPAGSFLLGNTDR